MNEETNLLEAPDLEPQGVDEEPAVDETDESTELEGQDTDEQDAGDEDDAEGADSEEDVDWEDGKKYRVPKALKEALMRHKDYTQKTQDVAAQRKALDERQQMIAKQAETMKANIQEYAQIHAVDAALTDLEANDWQAMMQEDPVRAQSEWMRFQQLKDARGRLAQGVQQKEYQATLEAQQSIAKQLEEGRAVLSRDIKDWSSAKAQELNNFAQEELGFTAQELSQVYDPRLVKLLHLAKIGKAAVQKTKSRTPESVLAKPVSTVKGKAPAGKDMSRMSTEEWMRARNTQLNKRK